ncbi:hypothetical protein GCM10018955_38900 [Planomonospora venezuelensis]
MTGYRPGLTSSRVTAVPTALPPYNVTGCTPENAGELIRAPVARVSWAATS